MDKEKNMEKVSENSVVLGSDKNVSEITNQVFKNELLLDIIVDHAIHDKGNVQISNVQKCRLVSKAWLQSTSRVLLKSREPLFRFYLCKPGLMAGDYAENEELLDDFLASVNGASRLSKSVPPYAIRASRFFMRERNHQRFFDVLVNCGDGLIELVLQLTQDLETIPINSTLMLSRLRNFAVCLYPVRPNVAVTNVNSLNDQIDFIQSIFDAGPELKTVKFRCDMDIDFAISSLHSIILPPSITELELRSQKNDYILEVAGKSPMPNLSTLTLYVEDVPFRDGLISALLKNVQKTLKTLCVRDTNSVNFHRPPNKFQLPLMEKLESLKIETPYLELEETYSSLEKLVPAVNHVTLTNQTIRMFRKWAEYSCFPSVNSITVSLVIGRVCFHESKGVNFDRGAMETLKRAFPNITELDMTIVGTDILALEFIIAEMRNLKRLRIVVDDNWEYLYVMPIPVCHFDAPLIGLHLGSFRSGRRHIKSVPQLKVPGIASICDLTDLHTLELESLYKGEGEDIRANPIISSLTFDYGFLKMPKLTKLVLKGRFFTTKAMARRCQEGGCSVESDFHEEESDE